MTQVRLQKVLSAAGVAARRKAEELITAGRVKVNGRVPPPEGLLIDPDHDQVTVDGRAIRPLTTHRYLMLNKPLGAITTARDEAGRTTVLDVVGDEGMGGHRLFPVGRLDLETSGLLILTNDTAFAERMTNPDYKVPKTYLVKASKHLTDAQLDQLRNERERLDKRVGLMRPDSIDPDMLDELARANLGFGKPGDLVITTVK